MHWFNEIAVFCNRFETRVAMVTAAALLLLSWLLMHLARPAPAPFRDGKFDRGGEMVLGLLLVPYMLLPRTLEPLAMTLLIVASTEVILRIGDRARAARFWDGLIGFTALSVIFGASAVGARSSWRPIADLGHPWALVVGNLLWTAAWMGAAFVAMSPERRASVRRTVPVLFFLGMCAGPSLLSVRVRCDPDQELPRASRPNSAFDAYELPARADLFSALDWQHRSLPRLPAELRNLRPFDANLPALAATLQADEVTGPDLEELRQSLPLAELLARRSESAAVVVAASLHLDEIRGPARASWRAELEHRWRQALVAQYRRLPQMREVLVAAILSHEVDFQAGRQQQVQAELQRLWGQDLGWPDGRPGFRAQMDSDLYDAESTSAGVWLARAYGWPDGTDPKELHRALMGAGSRFWLLGSMVPASHGNLHDAAALTMLRSFGSQPMTTVDLLRDWLDAFAMLFPALTLGVAALRIRRRFPAGIPPS
ncbi:MAG: hypothetical protein IPK26_31470 [Planctomycetes bacterium]|nr:hypothetical protein [Planctomycetota bacterium]